MTTEPVATTLDIRPYVDDDQSEVLDLLRQSLGEGPAGERTPKYFRWKHVDNPFGRSFMIVARTDERIIGFRALMRWQFRIDDRTVHAVRPVDTATHEEHRGRGVFSTLTTTALDELRGRVDLVFNTPNADSLPGYLKMGWQVVGRTRVSVRMCTPAVWRFAARQSTRKPTANRPLIDAPPAAEVLGDETAIESLIHASEMQRTRLATPLSSRFLRWRYGDAPLLGYHAVTEWSSGELAGVAIFRARSEGSVWGLVVSQLLVRAGDSRTARGLLRRVRGSADVAYVASLFPDGSAAARASRGVFNVRAPHSPTLVVNALRPDVRPDPRDLSSWALSLGDVEVF